MTLTSTPAGGSDFPEAAGTVGAPADPAFDAMAQRVLTRGHATTWLNHWSLLHADFRALARMHTVGFDGTLLQMRLRAAGHEVALLRPATRDRRPRRGSAGSRRLLRS